MKNIKQFIEQFIQDEYTCLKAEYDFSIPDAEYETFRQKASAYYIEANKWDYWRGLEEEEVWELDEQSKNLYAQNVNRAIPRTLFQIRQYEKPELGEGLTRWLTGDTLFACYTSYTENTGKPLGYNKLFYVAETVNGFRIIYDLTFGVKEPEWRHSHELKINQIKNAGKLIAVEKYQAPEEVASLEDYHKIEK